MTTPIIYFAGVNTNPLCEAFRGFHVLESFANIARLVDRHRPNFESMCLDSGAYSVAVSGKVIDVHAYAAFCVAHGGYDFYASLDSINGGVHENLENLSTMQAAGVDAMPTFHTGEPDDLLRYYCAHHEKIGLGMKRPTGLMPPVAQVREFLTHCFSIIPVHTKVHGWGMTNYTDYPFHSVDSTTWLWEMKALLATKGQGSEAIQCLTPAECIAIVQKKYIRLAKRRQWGFNENDDIEEF